jgi:adenylosuccinate synthase
VYETVEGWKENTRGINDFDRLPPKAQKYIRTIEELLNVSVQMISTGSKRDEIILLDKQF